MTSPTSPVPDAAHEVVSETWENGARKRAYYEIDGQRCAERYWEPSGVLTLEYGLADGKMHGLYRVWHDDGQLSQVTFFEHGKEHGTSRQYDEYGALIGSYTMEHGTGADLWFSRAGVLAEERYYVDGAPHGPERWWNDDNATVYQEAHYWHGKEHGIAREWNRHGRLRRGCPRYFVNGERVDKRSYERACRTDPSLPPFRVEENAPARALPASLRKTGRRHGEARRSGKQPSTATRRRSSPVSKG